LLLTLYFGCTTRPRNIPVGYLLHLLVQRHHGSLPYIYPPPHISSASTRGAKGQGDYGPDIVIIEEVDGVVVRKYHNSHCRDTLGGLFEGLPDLGLFSPSAEVSRFSEHQCPD
jgi:hypothetical protein